MKRAFDSTPRWILVALLLGPACSEDTGGDSGQAAVDAGGDADDDEPDARPAELNLITPEELHAALLSKDFLLINTHVPFEGEIPGTDAHIAYTDIDALVGYVGDDLSTKAVLYCRSGSMSDSSGRELAERGYREIYDLQGGMRAWEAAGYDLQ